MSESAQPIFAIFFAVFFHLTLNNKNKLTSNPLNMNERYKMIVEGPKVDIHDGLGNHDARELEIVFSANLNVLLESNQNLDGFDINQDLVSLFGKVFDQALEGCLDQLQLTVDDSDEPAYVDVDVQVKDSNVSDITGE